MSLDSSGNLVLDTSKSSLEIPRILKDSVAFRRTNFLISSCLPIDPSENRFGWIDKEGSTLALSPNDRDLIFKSFVCSAISLCNGPAGAVSSKVTFSP